MWRKVFVLQIYPVYHEYGKSCPLLLTNISLTSFFKNNIFLLTLILGDTY